MRGKGMPVDLNILENKRPWVGSPHLEKENLPSSNWRSAPSLLVCLKEKKSLVTCLSPFGDVFFFVLAFCSLSAARGLPRKPWLASSFTGTPLLGPDPPVALIPSADSIFHCPSHQAIRTAILPLGRQLGRGQLVLRGPDLVLKPPVADPCFKICQEGGVVKESTSFPLPPSVSLLTQNQTVITLTQIFLALNAVNGSDPPRRSCFFHDESIFSSIC